MELRSRPRYWPAFPAPETRPPARPAGNAAAKRVRALARDLGRGAECLPDLGKEIDTVSRSATRSTRTHQADLNAYRPAFWIGDVTAESDGCALRACKADLAPAV